MKHLYVLFLIALITACQTSAQVIQNSTASSIGPNAIDTQRVYQQSIVNAMSPEPSKIFDDLIQIDRSNKNLVWKEIGGEDYLLVVTWKEDSSFYHKYVDSAYFPTGTHILWVTTAPELLNRMNAEPVKDADTRLRQLIGLPPNSKYTCFVEFWVKPADLVRPCPDKEITDGNCGLCFTNSTDTAHINWINGNRVGSYYSCALYDKYPWTQLGYTYDWDPANKTHIGLSEFLIGENKRPIINKIYTTEEYLNKKVD